jgi:multicomponent K+:H+ antiporter subunit D
MISFLNNHLPILPIALPLFAAALALIMGEHRHNLNSAIAWVCVLLLLGLGALAIDRTAAGHSSVYLLGNWQAPIGITLVVDKLTAIMLMLTAVVAAVALTAARQLAADGGTFFIPLFMLQLMGLNGAFLTADLFNLFVFFEVLLAASYGLLLQQTDRAKTNAATHYVVINLVGSALFLIAASLLYGLTGTLNMADLSQQINAVPPESRSLVLSAGFILLTVFAIKAALLPLNFWLTGTYRAAILPVAALFALMTKVGIVAMIRTLTLLFPDGTVANIAMSKALIILAPLTMLIAALGALAARDVKTLIGWSVVGAAGLLATALAIGSAKALSGALFYLIGSTLATALLFLNAAGMENSPENTPESKYLKKRWAWIGAFFLIGAVTTAGLPPFSGFIGKAVVLAGATQHVWLAWITSIVLLSGLLSIIAFARLGSQLFWKGDISTFTPQSMTSVVTTSTLAVAILALTIFAAPIQRYTDQAAIELRQPQSTIANVLRKQQLPVEKKMEGAK